jgi:hypothetical protein
MCCRMAKSELAQINLRPCILAQSLGLASFLLLGKCKRCLAQRRGFELRSASS